MERGWRKNYLRYKTFFLNMLTQYRERSDWKAYIEILLSLATVSIFSVFALRPTLMTIASLVKEIEEKKATLATMNGKIQNLSRAQTLYDQQRGKIQLLVDSAIPKRENSDVFSRQIESLSQKHQVGISTFTLGKAVILGKQKDNSDKKEEDQELLPEGANQISFSVTARVGIDQFPSLVSFLSDFENLRMPQQIGELRINVDEDSETKEKSLILNINGQLPYLGSSEVKQ